MKAFKLFSYFLLSLTVTLVSCSTNGDDTPDVTPSENTIEMSTDDQTVGSEPESISLSFKTSDSWTASSNQSWCTVSPASGNKGSNTITVSCEKNSNNSERSAIVTIKCGNVSKSIKINQLDGIPYLTFSADGEQSLTMSLAVETLQYSVNGDEWKELGTNTVIFGGDNGDLRLRGKNPNGTAIIDSGFYQYAIIDFNGVNMSPVSCSGDIRTLLDYENYMTVDTSKAAFMYLFNYCNELISAPELPATTLSEYCYVGMFMGCTSLVNAPELPATTLAEACYGQMFMGCTSLVNAPKLPATTLAKACYGQMFEGCTSLVHAPELSATTLAERCYQEMFEYCTSLVNAPALPATKLAKECYGAMFMGCTSLVNAPELPATTLAKGCYYEMFSECTSLVNTPKLPATTLAEGCYREMFSECTSLVNAPKELPATILAECCYEQMFHKCISLVNAPELPATKLAEGCCREMFEGCTSLIKAPELLATTLVRGCYTSMFQECSKLNYVKMMATDIISWQACFAWWLDGVSSTGTFVKNKNATWDESHVIPSGWTVITE